MGRTRVLSIHRGSLHLIFSSYVQSFQSPWPVLNLTSYRFTGQIIFGEGTDVDDPRVRSNPDDPGSAGQSYLELFKKMQDLPSADRPTLYSIQANFLAVRFSLFFDFKT